MKSPRWPLPWLPGLLAAGCAVLHFSLGSGHMARWLSLTSWCG